MLRLPKGEQLPKRPELMQGMQLQEGAQLLEQLPKKEMEDDMNGTKEEMESIESDASLHLLSHSELELTQRITLNQMRGEPDGRRLLLLGRVWYRLEQERRRRRDEIRELNRLYFTRAEAPPLRTAVVT
jgi:hypothetical protein